MRAAGGGTSVKGSFAVPGGRSTGNLREMGQGADVVVIGGGAVGACCALELARRGADVVLIERGERVSAGCSFGNAGLICPSHASPLATPAALRDGVRMLMRRDSPFHIRPRIGVVPWLARFAASATTARAAAATAVLRQLSMRSLEAHAALAAAGIPTGFERRGILNVYETERGLQQGWAEAQEHARHGHSGTFLAVEEARALVPALVGPVAGAILFDQEAHCEPASFVGAVAAAASEAGARLRVGTEALQLRTLRRKINSVESTAGSLSCGHVVLAAGVWSGELARQVGVFVPLEGGKGYHVEVPLDERAPAMPVFLQEARVIVTPLPGRLRLAGTLELSGLDDRVDRIRLEAVVRAARRALDLGEPRVTRVWRGLRPCTPDGLPIVGRAAEVDNLVLATGHAMLGLTLAPLTGMHVAEIVSGREPADDLTMLRPDRFRTLRSRLLERGDRERPAAPSPPHRSPPRPMVVSGERAHRRSDRSP